MNIILPALPIDGDMSIVEVLEVAIDQPFETKVVLIWRVRVIESLPQKKWVVEDILEAVKLWVSTDWEKGSSFSVSEAYFSHVAESVLHILFQKRIACSIVIAFEHSCDWRNVVQGHLLGLIVEVQKSDSTFRHDKAKKFGYLILFILFAVFL